MTMKFTTSRIENTISPISTSPPIRKPPNAATTWPAAQGPSLPCERISRVVATFSDSRSSVVSSSRVGKLVKSSGRSRNNATISTSTERGDRERQPEIEHQRGQRQDQHRQQQHHAERQPDVGARASAGAEPRRRSPASGMAVGHPPPQAAGRGNSGTAMPAGRRRHRRRPAPRSRAACCAARGWKCRGWWRHGCGCPGCGPAFPGSGRARPRPCVRPDQARRCRPARAPPPPRAAAPGGKLDRLDADAVARQRAARRGGWCSPVRARCRARRAQPRRCERVRGDSGRGGKPFTSA